MKNKNLFFIKILIGIFIPFSLSGCWNSRQLSDLQIVVGIGIDKADIPDNVLLTAQIVKTNELKNPSKTGAGEEGKPYKNIISSSQTVFDAVREFTHEISNKLYISHNQVIVLSRDIADEGVQKYLDFFMRAGETRPTTAILISKGTAGEVFDIQTKLDKLPAISIAKLVKAQDFTSQSMYVNLQDLTSSLVSKTTSAVIPLLAIKDKGTQKTLVLGGMAVFKRDKMVGELTESESRGLLWIKGGVKSGVVDIPCYGGKASIEIKNAESKVDLKINGGKVYVYIKIKEHGILVGQTYSGNLATLASFELLEKSQARIIQGEIISALKKARELNTDIFGFGEEVHKKYRVKWKEIEKDWDEIFPSLHIETEIECKINATGLITKPATAEGDQ